MGEDVKVVVPESVLKNRKKEEDWALAKNEELDATKKKRAESRKLIYNREKELIRLKREAKLKGGFYVDPEINEEASDKVLEVEQKYNEIRKPVYNKRNDVVKSIPDFWFTAFMSHPALYELLNVEDQKIFMYLGSLDVEDNKDVKSGYSITFNFNPNPYFENIKLTKTFTFLEEGTAKITATPIKWKMERGQGKAMPNELDHDKNGNKWARIDISFFSWFSDCEQKNDVDEIHDEVAELIKDDLWPNPLTYFNNVS
ncbi:NAP1-related protein 2 [Glycine max]|uniref:NAP1-related protein 2 n=1 Tax=Glycine max TaxID=3847 RepID=UPI001B357154|nr:NAP1-related protein 2-like [Glycine max]